MRELGGMGTQGMKGERDGVSDHYFTSTCTGGFIIIHYYNNADEASVCVCVYVCVWAGNDYN